MTVFLLLKKMQISKQYSKYSVLFEGLPYSYCQFFQGVSAIPLHFDSYMALNQIMLFDNELIIRKHRLF